MELALIIIITLSFIPLVVFTEGFFRIIFGLLFLIFFPGYTLLAALFPKKDSLNSIERIALSFVISLVIAPLIMLSLNHIWEISLYPIVICIAVFIIIASIIAILRRVSLPKTERFEPSLNITLPHWNKMGSLEQFLYLILIFVILGTIGTLIYVVVNPKTGEPFTEFYVLGSDGMVVYDFGQLEIGDEIVVTPVIENHEHQETTYQMKVRMDEELIQESGDITLSHEQKWEGTVTFSPTKAGEDQITEFVLYKGEEAEPYRVLALQIDVEAG